MANTGLRDGMKAEYNRTVATWKEVGGTPFRKGLIAWAMDNYGCTLASAASTYAEVKNKFETEHPELKEMLDGLGRAPEKNNGGRKKKVATVVVGAADEAGETATEQTLFNVKRKSDGVVVAENVSLEAAQELIAKNKSAKKAALYFI